MSRVALRVTLLLGIVALVSCGFPGDIDGDFKKIDDVAMAVEVAVGVRPEVGFRRANGRLAEVRITFPFAAVAELPLGRLRDASTAAVRSVFREPADAIEIVIRVQASSSESVPGA